mmetsp:Transcript_49495/g.146192  ORF Transcript_49495/g.146192 Transcript_49495/m.146192 type:complete len:199 (-) Transcript_49495:79-675(-)
MDFRSEDGRPNAAALGMAADAAAAGKQALGSAGEAWSVVHEYIQRGPEGMSWLCFMGGFVTAVFGFVGFIDIFDAMLSPLYYLVNLYQMMFGLTTCIIEAPVEWVEKSAKLKQGQRFIYDFMKFLTTFGGRGLFYLFQGTLALSLADSVSLQSLLALYMSGCGVFCIAAQFGLKPNFLNFHTREISPGALGGDYIHIT